MPGVDPSDINEGARYIFLENYATQKIRHNKKKVTYIFEGEGEGEGEEKPAADEENKMPEEQQAAVAVPPVVIKNRLICEEAKVEDVIVMKSQ